MNQEKYQIGLKNLEKIDGDAGRRVIDSLAEVGRDIGNYIIEFAFGEIYERPTLDLKQREMITLTSLLTQGDTSNQLWVHIKGALNVGLNKTEIIEIFIQCIPYVGFPKVLNAVTVAQAVFEEERS